MSKVKISYELDLYEDACLVKSLLNFRDYESTLEEIHGLVRNKLKHGDDDWLETGAYKFLEEIIEIIYDSGVTNG